MAGTCPYDTCTGNCMNSCSGTCILGCSSACDGRCKASCQGSCSDQCGHSCIGKCYGSCKNACKGGCDDNCNNNCSGGCRGSCTSCSGSCSGGCKGGCTSCSGGCGGGCKGTCTSCKGTCKATCADDCEKNCRLGCKNYCNSGCSGGAMADAYTYIKDGVAIAIVGKQMENIRALLLHELDRLGLAGLQSAKAHSDFGKQIIYGEKTITEGQVTAVTNVGAEVDENTQKLIAIQTALLNNGRLKRDEIVECVNYLRTAYNTVIPVPNNDTTKNPGKTRRSNGTKITETGYNPWNS